MMLPAGIILVAILIMRAIFLVVRAKRWQAVAEAERRALREAELRSDNSQGEILCFSMPSPCMSPPPDAMRSSTRKASMRSPLPELSSVEGYKNIWKKANIALLKSKRGSITASSSSGQFDGSQTIQREPVHCTVFAPEQVCIGYPEMVQLWVDLPEQDEKVRAAALELDSEAQLRGVTSLATEIQRGSKLTFELLSPIGDIDEPVQELTWRGDGDYVQFLISVPDGAKPQAIFPKVLISQNSVPIGQIKFKLTLVERSEWTRMGIEPLGQSKRYEKAFISYASHDRAEVLRRVQMLSAVGVRFFQDLLTLEPGQKWEEEIYHHIDDSDVMLLFWSKAAQQSEWVEKEWRYGLNQKGEDFIRPVIVEGPPIALPPPELAHLHFNDRLLYFIHVENSAQEPARSK